MPVPRSPLPVQSLEHTEQLVRVGHVEAHPVVLDEIDGLPDPPLSRRHPMSICLLPAPSEFEGIVQKVGHHLPHQIWVSTAGGVRDHDLHRSLPLHGVEFLYHLLGHPGQVDGLACNARRFKWQNVRSRRRAAPRGGRCAGSCGGTLSSRP